jgi:hypothetical protein
MAPALELKGAQFCAAMQHRLNMSPLPHNTVGIRCTCAAVPSADNAMTCSSVKGKATMRHDILKGILLRTIHRAGVASTLEPTLRRLPGVEAGAYGALGGTEAAGLEARGHILLALESGMSVVDVSITHPSGVANRAAAATTDSAAAARRDREKRGTYGQLEPNGYPIIPFSMETYGRLGKPAIIFRRQLGLEAKEAGTRLASLALCRPPSVSLVWGCAGVTIRCIGHRWACLQWCRAVGSVRELLTPRRRCCDRYQCPDLSYVPWSGRSGLQYVWSSEKI